MTGGEIAAIIGAVAMAILAVGLIFALGSLTRTLHQLRLAVEDFRAEALPLVSQLRSTVAQTNAELGRVDALLDTAENISGTVDSASRLAYLFFSNPVVKTMAFGTGAARAARRLRRSRTDQKALNP